MLPLARKSAPYRGSLYGETLWGPHSSPQQAPTAVTFQTSSSARADWEEWRRRKEGLPALSTDRAALRRERARPRGHEGALDVAGSQEALRARRGLPLCTATPAALQGFSGHGSPPGGRPAVALVQERRESTKRVLNHETFHAKPGTCGRSALPQGSPHSKGRAKTWWGGMSPTQFPTREGSRRNGLLPTTIGLGESLGLGTGREP